MKNNMQQNWEDILKAHNFKPCRVWLHTNIKDFMEEKNFSINEMATILDRKYATIYGYAYKGNVIPEAVNKIALERLGVIFENSKLHQLLEASREQRALLAKNLEAADNTIMHSKHLIRDLRETLSKCLNERFFISLLNKSSSKGIINMETYLSTRTEWEHQLFEDKVYYYLVSYTYFTKDMTQPIEGVELFGSKVDAISFFTHLMSQLRWLYDEKDFFSTIPLDGVVTRTCGVRGTKNLVIITKVMCNLPLSSIESFDEKVKKVTRKEVK